MLVVIIVVSTVVYLGLGVITGRLLYLYGKDPALQRALTDELVFPTMIVLFWPVVALLILFALMGMVLRRLITCGRQP